MMKLKKPRKQSAQKVESAPTEEQQIQVADNADERVRAIADGDSTEPGVHNAADVDVLDLRVASREGIDLKTIVQVKEGGEIWEETAVIHSVSKAGAGFNLSRPCVVGRLVTLVMPLQPQLRAYDIDERLYTVMAVVQYCHEIAIDGVTTYNVGTAFIGKKIPSSYSANSDQNYRLTGMAENGLWNVAEAMAPFQVRKHSRFWVEVQVSLTILQRDRRAVCKDVTRTKDISSGGAAIHSSVAANIGDKVKFTCKEYDFFSMAVVRGRSVDASDRPTIHVEFLDAKFPVHLLPKPEGISFQAKSDMPYVANPAIDTAVELV